MRIHLPEQITGARDSLFVLDLEVAPAAQERQVQVSTEGGLQALDLRGTGPGGTYTIPAGQDQLHVPLRVTADGAGEAAVVLSFVSGPEAGTRERRGVRLLAPGPALPASRSRSMLPVAVLAAVVLVAVLVAQRMLGGATVPSVVGKRSGEAVRLLQGARLGPKVAREDVAEASRDGVVLRQAPVAGSRVKSDSEVQLVVGRYVAPKAEVPELVGATAEQAESALRTLGFQPVLSYRPVPEGGRVGKVLAQSPAAGTTLEADSVVEVFVGRAEPAPAAPVAQPAAPVQPVAPAQPVAPEPGPQVPAQPVPAQPAPLPPTPALPVSPPAAAERGVKVPDVTGLSRSDAEWKLADAGLMAEFRDEVAAADMVGKVLGQQPAAGARVESLSQVVLRVGRAGSEAPAPVAPQPQPTAPVVPAPVEPQPVPAQPVQPVQPVQPAPVQPTVPGQPVPSQPEPTPAAPQPVVPQPVVPQPVAPTPPEPGPLLPTPPQPVSPPPVVPPTPVTPTPPTPVEPVPVQPVAPQPVAPQPVPTQPAPTQPTPVEPGPVVPAPVAGPKVPDMVGLWRDAAESQLRAAGLPFEVVLRSTYDLEDGRVLGHVPGPGEALAAGQAVVLEVARAPTARPVRLPDLRGLSLEKATQALRDAGLLLREKAGTGTPAEQGAVVDQAPAAGTEVAPRSWVEVVVARTVGPSPRTQPAPGSATMPQAPAVGPGSPEPVVPTPRAPVALPAQVRLPGRDVAPSLPVPALATQPVRQAIEAVLRAGQMPIVDNDRSAGAALGSVLRQSPEPGALARAGDLVRLTVAMGPTGNDRNVTLPAAYGIELKRAQQMFVAQGLNVEVIVLAVPGHPYTGTERVVAQFPAGTVGAAAARTVTIWVLR
ncbi:MAG: PASTA domain-containing protein [Planctomycetia bacterium]